MLNLHNQSTCSVEHVCPTSPRYRLPPLMPLNCPLYCSRSWLLSVSRIIPVLHGTTSLNFAFPTESHLTDSFNAIFLLRAAFCFAPHKRGSEIRSPTPSYEHLSLAILFTTVSRTSTSPSPVLSTLFIFYQPRYSAKTDPIYHLPL
jgi:hypothetical protein